MKSVRGGWAAGTVVLGAVLLAGCSGGTQPTATESAKAAAPSASAGAALPTEAPPTPAAGSYIDYTTYETDPQVYAAEGNVVLFFNASWCPTCQAAQKSFTSLPVPAGLTLVSVDYDDSQALRQQYGVTVQHTFVQVNAAGDELAKWTGSTTAEQVAERTV